MPYTQKSSVRPLRSSRLTIIQDLNEALAEELSEDFSDAETLKNIADGLPCSDVFEGDRQYQAAKHAIDAYMDGVGKCLASMWDDPRYTRTDYDDMF